jgi:TolB protein
MRNILLSIFLFTLLSLPLHAKIYIDIDSPNPKKINIAIQSPVSMDNIQPDSTAINVYSDTLNRDLELTGLFELVDPKAFLEKATRESMERDNIDFKSWSIIGSEILLKTGYWTLNSKFKVLVRLYDVITGEVLLAKTYECEERSLKQLAHTVTNEIVKSLTGKEGMSGSKVAFVSDQTGKKELYIMDIDGTDLIRITNHRTSIVSPVWNRDGTELLFTSYLSRNPDVYLYDFSIGKMFSISRRDGINISGDFSPDGKNVLLTLSYEGNPEIYQMNLESKSLKRLTNYWGIDVSPVFSPDGKQIAFVSDRAGTPQIYIMNSDGTNVRRVTYEGKYNASPRWSPDGKKIVFNGILRDNINFKIFLINPDGSELIQLTNGAGSDENPSWSPDGRYILFSSTRDGNSELYITNINGNHLYRLTRTPYNETHPAWGPVVDFKLSKR